MGLGIRKFLKGFFSQEAAAPAAVPAPVRTESNLVRMPIYPRDANNRFISNQNNEFVILDANVNMSRLNEREYTIGISAAALLRGIRDNKIGVQDLIRTKMFTVVNAKAVAATDVFQTALLLLDEPKNGHRWFGKKTPTGKLILHTALGSATRRPADIGFAATEHAPL